MYLMNKIYYIIKANQCQYLGVFLCLLLGLGRRDCFLTDLSNGARIRLSFFRRKGGAKKAVPYHVGTFDEKTPCIFDDENKIILEIYKEREI